MQDDWLGLSISLPHLPIADFVVSHGDIAGFVVPIVVWIAGSPIQVEPCGFELPPQHYQNQPSH